MELKILFKNTSYLLTARIAKFAVGFIRAKLVAILLGTIGAGIISQLNQLTLLLSQFSMQNMNDGLVKEISESNKQEKEFGQKLAGLIKSYVIMVIIILSLVLAISMYFSKELTVYFFGDIKYYGYLFIGLASFPILVINSISFAILKSFKQIKYIARSELIVLFINLLLFIPMIYFWGLTGAVIHIALALVSILIVNHYYAQTIILSSVKITYIDILRAKITRKAIRELFVFVGYGLTAGMALNFTDTITRTIIVTKLGIDAIGLYSPVIIWASLFTGFIMPSIDTYLYPRFCECKSDPEMIGVMNDSLRFVTLLMVPFILISIPIRFQIIPLFYSYDFKVAGNYLPWHFLGTLIYLWMYIFWRAMMPTGRIKIEGVLVIIMCIIDFILVYVMVPGFGLYAYMLKFLISPILFFVFYFIFWKKAIHFKLDLENLVLMGYSLISYIIIMAAEKFITANYKINFLIGLSLTGLLFFMLNKSEKKYISNKLREGVIAIYSNKWLKRK